MTHAAEPAIRCSMPGQPLASKQPLPGPSCASAHSQHYKFQHVNPCMTFASIAQMCVDGVKGCSPRSGTGTQQEPKVRHRGSLSLMVWHACDAAGTQQGDAAACSDAHQAVLCTCCKQHPRPAQEVHCQRAGAWRHVPPPRPPAWLPAPASQLQGPGPACSVECDGVGSDGTQKKLAI